MNDALINLGIVVVGLFFIAVIVFIAGMED